jgi:hypothetical protein
VKSCGRNKARLVALGKHQSPDLYDETSSPVAKASSNRVLVAIANDHDLEMDVVDIDQAFLHAKLREEIYMEQPEGFQKTGPNGEEMVCHLNKSIYELLRRKLALCGLKASKADPCVHVRLDAAGKLELAVATHVDDTNCVGTPEALRQFKHDLAKHFPIKDLGPAKFMLGMEVKRDRAARTTELVQTAHTEQVLEKCGMSNSKPVSTPAEGVLRWITDENVEPDKEYVSRRGEPALRRRDHAPGHCVCC